MVTIDIKNKMQKFEKVFVQFYKRNNAFKLTPSCLRFFTTDKSTVSETLHEKEAEKSIEQQNINQQNASTPMSEDSFTTAFAKDISLNKYKNINEEAPFATLLRHSNLMHLGDPEGKVVTGEIVQVINNDLYIDFGWKFHCVCSKPIKNSSDYVRGAKVRLRIKDLELSTRFLGFTKDVTLLEADCVLLGLISTPNRINKTVEAPEPVTETAQ